jgi:formate hydrogenlyase subunit 3/multisubunit Na+/H+ antiporter MnhD subunit
MTLPEEYLRAREMVSYEKCPMHLVYVKTAFALVLGALGVLVPLVLMVRRGRAARGLAIGLVIGSNLMGCFVAALCLWRDIDPNLDLSNFTPFPFKLGIDKFSALFLLLICTVATPVAVFATSYFARHYAEARRNWMWAFFSLFLLSMIVVVAASTGFAFLAGWELMTLVSAALILIEGDTAERRHNLFIYLLMMHAGAAAVAASFFLFLPYSHSLDFAQFVPLLLPCQALPELPSS